MVANVRSFFEGASLLLLLLLFTEATRLLIKEDWEDDDATCRLRRISNLRDEAVRPEQRSDAMSSV